MMLTLRRVTTTAAAAVLAGSGLLCAASGARASTAPPWEPDGSSVGGLIFFDSAGDIVTGGSVNDSPIAAYVEGTNALRAGDTKATLFGYLPVDGQVPGQFSGEAMSASVAYPPAGAPNAVSATLPVVTGADDDESVATLAADFPNNDVSDDGYAGLYQLRLKTSAPEQSLTTTYDSADIQITGDTWSVVYSNTQTATATTLTVSPSSSAYHGTAVTLKASVTPSTAAGTVQFRDGTKLLSSVPVSAGAASYSTKTLADGTHKLTATFVPTSATAYSQSSSTAHSLTVKAHPTATKLKASKTSIKKGKKLTLTATETPKVAGSVTFYDGTKKLAKVTAKSGKATYATKKLKKGTHKIKAVFTPSNTANDSASTSKVVKVKVVKAKVKK